MNAIPPISRTVNDSLRSLFGELGGIGSERDKGSQSFYTPPRISQIELRNMVESSWLAARAVEQVASDLTSRWRTWQGRSSDVLAIESEEQRLGLQQKLAKALMLSAREGGALLLIGAGSQNPQEPLDPAVVGKGGLAWIQTMSRSQISLGPLDNDPASPWFGQPSEYRLALPNGRYLAVHPSRVCLIVTSPALDTYETGEPWGTSALQRAYQPIKDYEQTLRAIQHLVFESKQDVISIENLSQLVTNPEHRAAIVARFALATSMKGLFGTLLLDKAETFEARQLNLGAGLPEIVDRLVINVCGALEIPASRLFGRSSASGLQASTAGESDDQRYFSGLASKQRNIIAPAIRTLDQCILRSALGRTPRRNAIFYEWAPLWSESAETLSNVRLRHAQAAAALAGAGLVDLGALGKAVVSQSEDDGWLPALGQHVTAVATSQQPDATEAPDDTEE